MAVDQKDICFSLTGNHMAGSESHDGASLSMSTEVSVERRYGDSTSSLS